MNYSLKNILMKTLKKVSILIPILLIGLFNYAQAANAILKGKVVDKVSKSALPLVNVYLKTTSGKLVKSTSTDLNGKFEIKDITPDKYNITVDIIGYKKLINTMSFLLLEKPKT